MHDMSGLEIKAGVHVKDIMSSPPITVNDRDTVEIVAKLMTKNNIGSIVVSDEEGNPIGMITERDIVTRVVAKNAFPSKVKAGDIMSRPLIGVEPETDINEAAKKMSKLKVRRLVVMEKGKLVGIVSSKDIVSITPALMEIIAEKARITGPAIEKPAMLGYCDVCGQWSEALREVDGKYLCEDCRADLEPE
jgi:CBS domain-containing protein